MPSAGRLVKSAGAVAETLRLLGEWEQRAPSPGPIGGLRAQAREGRFPGLLWVGPKDEAAGLVRILGSAPVGRRVALYLAEGYRTPAALGSLVDALEADSPLLALADEALFLPPASQARALRPRGFFRVTRTDMVYPPENPLPPPGATVEGLRALSEVDMEEIGRLLERAYSDDPIERAIFVESRDAGEDARRTAHDLLVGRYGPWIRPASFGVEHDGRLVAVTLVNDLHGPLFTEVAVDPDHRRHGLARALLRRSLGALRTGGYAQPRLVVTGRNQRAVALYRSVGFVPLPETKGALWINLRAAGVERPREDDLADR